MSDDRTYDLDFHFDPVCPWAWVTSQWVREVERIDNLRVNWTFICLWVLNEPKYADGSMSEQHIHTHGRGRRLLRVAAAIRKAEGSDPMGAFYKAAGTTIHIDGMGESLDTVEGIASMLRSAGIDESFAAAADDETLDQILRDETKAALDKTGKDVGTPILQFNPPTGSAIFGPVISVAPKGDYAVELWKHVTALSADPNFAELKRAIRMAPDPH